VIQVAIKDVKTEAASRQLAAVADAMRPEAVDVVVGQVAAATWRKVVERTPKRWFGDLRRQWTVEHPRLGLYVVKNPSRVMGFIEFGTANEGTGRIYPKNGKALYIPLTRRAALKWSPELEYGVDYILRPSVKGIKPRWLVRAQREESALMLKVAAEAHIGEAIRRSTT